MSQGRLTIDLNALAQNYHILKEKVGGRVEVSPVLKANAYSLGATPVAQRLLQEGCAQFFVATPAEGVELRALNNSCIIMILNGFYASRHEDYLTHNLTPVLGSFMEIKAYQNLAKKSGRILPAALNFNIRMNRLGLGKIETEELMSNMSMLEGLNIVCVMSHFACVDIPNHPMTELQYEIFLKIAAHFPRAKKSLANSSGIFRNSKYHFDIVRPGMALYGLNPVPEQKSPMKSVISLNVPIMRIRIVYAGASIGYGASYVTDRDMSLAVVSAGYADGLLWSLSNKGKFYWQGYPCPIRGRVSMDMTTVDLSEIPEEKRPKPGDYLEVIGAHQREADLAKDAGSFDYEVLTSLGQRYERVYC